MEEIPTLEQLKQMRKPLVNIHRKVKENFSMLNKFALWITENVGTMGFFIILLIWTLIWLLWNTFGPSQFRFDPFPAFALWLFISNMIQILLLPIIMIGQNIQGMHSEARSESDFEVNLRAEREIEAILMHLEKQDKQLEELLKKVK